MATSNTPATLRRIARAIPVFLLAVTGALAPIQAVFAAGRPASQSAVPAYGEYGPDEPLSTESLLHVDRIGPVLLGMTIDEAKEAAGVPLELEDGPYCTSLHGTGDLDGIILTATDKPSGRVDFITVTGAAPNATDEGVKIGSAFQDALDAYAGRVEVVDLGDAYRLIVREGDDVLVLDVWDGAVVYMAIGQPALADEACA